VAPLARRAHSPPLEHLGTLSSANRPKQHGNEGAGADIARRLGAFETAQASDAERSGDELATAVDPEAGG
jgi:hypothetical protein